jgi:hypothetical protein
LFFMVGFIFTLLGDFIKVNKRFTQRHGGTANTEKKKSAEVRD